MGATMKQHRHSQRACFAIARPSDDEECETQIQMQTKLKCKPKFTQIALSFREMKLKLTKPFIQNLTPNF